MENESETHIPIDTEIELVINSIENFVSLKLYS